MAARPWCLFVMSSMAVSACATRPTVVPEPTPTTGADAVLPPLVSDRCRGRTCTCRRPSDGPELPPPEAGKKRIEIRMSVANGTAVLDSPTLGRFEHAGLEEACYYVDMPVGVAHDVRLYSREASEGTGVSPRVHISEYGPLGAYWYDILHVACGTGERRCDPELAREWGQGWVASRKRGRLEACGSIVVTGLKWSTSGGQAAQNGGLLRDFNAQFFLEAMKFGTQYPPGAKECRIGH